MCTCQVHRQTHGNHHLGDIGGSGSPSADNDTIGMPAPTTSSRPGGIGRHGRPISPEFPVTAQPKEGFLEDGAGTSSHVTYTDEADCVINLPVSSLNSSNANMVKPRGHASEQ